MHGSGRLRTNRPRWSYGKWAAAWDPTSLRSAWAKRYRWAGWSHERNMFCNGNLTVTSGKKYLKKMSKICLICHSAKITDESVISVSNRTSCFIISDRTLWGEAEWLLVDYFPQTSVLFVCQFYLLKNDTSYFLSVYGVMWNISETRLLLWHRTLKKTKTNKTEHLIEHNCWINVSLHKTPAYRRWFVVLCWITTHYLYTMSF